MSKALITVWVQVNGSRHEIETVHDLLANVLDGLATLTEGNVGYSSDIAFEGEEDG